MGRFAKWYAGVNDDIRHKVIEEGWFGKKVTDPLNEQDIPGLKKDGPAPTTINQVDNSTSHTSTVNNFYQPTRENEAGAQDLYGSTSREPTSQPEPDHEPEH